MHDTPSNDVRPEHTGSLRSALLAALSAGLLVYALTFGIKLVGSTVDRSIVRERLQQAFATGELRDEGFAPGDFARGVNQFNDCLVLQPALLSHGKPWIDAASTSTVADPAPCVALRRLVQGSEVSADARYAYDRYVFGASTVSTIALRFSELSSIRSVSSAIAYVLLLVTFVGGLRYALRAARASDALRIAAGATSNEDRLRFGLTVAIASAGLAAAYGLHLFARNISHVYSEIVIAAFVLVSLLTGAGRDVARERRVVALFGALTAVFELLTGPVVVGAVLVAVFATNRSTENSQIGSFRYAWRMVIVYSAGFATVMATQAVIASLATGRNAFNDVWVHLAVRMQLHQVMDIAVPELWRIPTNLASYRPAEIFAQVRDALPLLTYGSYAAAIAISLLTVVLVAAGLWAALRSADGEARIRAITLMSLLPIVPAWYLILGNHTVIHILFTIRLVTALWICAGVIALVGGLASRRARPASGKPVVSSQP